MWALQKSKLSIKLWGHSSWLFHSQNLFHICSSALNMSTVAVKKSSGYSSTSVLQIDPASVLSSAMRCGSKALKLHSMLQCLRNQSWSPCIRKSRKDMQTVDNVSADPMFHMNSDWLVDHIDVVLKSRNQWRSPFLEPWQKVMQIHLLHHSTLPLLCWTLGQRALCIVQDWSYATAELLIGMQTDQNLSIHSRDQRQNSSSPLQTALKTLLS